MGTALRLDCVWRPGHIFSIPTCCCSKALSRIDHLVSVSPEAKPLAEKYGHYFMLPFAARDYSASSGTLQFAGVALAAFTWFTGFKWGVLCALVDWLLMGYVAHSFSPVAVLAKYPELRSA
jgi:hypothetical protein